MEQTEQKYTATKTGNKDKVHNLVQILLQTMAQVFFFTSRQTAVLLTV